MCVRVQPNNVWHTHAHTHMAAAAVAAAGGDSSRHVDGKLALLAMRAQNLQCTLPPTRPHNRLPNTMYVPNISSERGPGGGEFNTFARTQSARGSSVLMGPSVNLLPPANSPPPRLQHNVQQCARRNTRAEPATRH